MTEASLPSKLAAIVSIDIAGYSSLVERDAGQALAHVSRLRERAHAEAERLGGRVFNTAGDGVMLEFPSAAAALNGAIALCEAETEALLRFGVHLGDVVEAADGDVLGQGVNIAARLQAEASPGGILVSKMVRDAAGRELAGRLSPRGRIKLAKMRETLAVFSLDLRANAARIIAEPVLAVLAFDCPGRERAMRTLCDGVSEEILFAVSRMPGIKVLGATSIFAFRGRAKAKAAKALSATHVLDGSVRRAGDSVRVAAHLLEAETGVVLWSDRYDRDLGDAFALQEEIAGLRARQADREERQVA